MVSGYDVLTDSEDRLVVFAASNISEQGTLSQEIEESTGLRLSTTTGFGFAPGSWH
jgi:hypothetical protein